MRPSSSDRSHSTDEIRLNALGLDEKIWLGRLSAELKERCGAYTTSSRDFVVSACRAIDSMKGSANFPLRMSCLWECCQFLFTNGEYQEALRAGRTLEHLAESRRDKAWIRRAYTTKGVVQSELGDVGGALVTYERAYRLALEEGEFYQVIAVTNIGTALNYCSLYNEAIACFQHAIRLTTPDILSSNPETVGGIALGNLAQSYLYSGRPHEGYEAIKQSILQSGEPQSGRAALSRTIREWTYVLLALELGKLQEARRHSNECRKYSGWRDNPRGAALADIAEGLCEIHEGETLRGTELLERALARAPNHAQREDALRALIKCYDATGRESDALKCVDELVSQLRARSERGLAALSTGIGSLGTAEGHSPDLRVLEHRGAALRAKLAERRSNVERREFLERLAITADLKNDISGEHGFRVGKLSALLAFKIGLGSGQCEAIEMAGRLHDIGKIGIPDRVLLASAALHEADRRTVSTHAMIGAELLSKSALPDVKISECVAKHHHEWWDGSGYPTGLKGKQIPLPARIVALADVFDALTHGRPYAAPWTVESALGEIRSKRGTQFDPDLVEPFTALIADLLNDYQVIDEYLGRAARESAFWQARARIRSMLAVPDAASGLAGP